MSGQIRTLHFIREIPLRSLREVAHALSEFAPVYQAKKATMIGTSLASLNLMPAVCHTIISCPTPKPTNKNRFHRHSFKTLRKGVF